MLYYNYYYKPTTKRNVTRGVYFAFWHYSIRHIFLFINRYSDIGLWKQIGTNRQSIHGIRVRYLLFPTFRKVEEDIIYDIMRIYNRCENRRINHELETRFPHVVCLVLYLYIRFDIVTFEIESDR